MQSRKTSRLIAFLLQALFIFLVVACERGKTSIHFRISGGSGMPLLFHEVEAHRLKLVDTVILTHKGIYRHKPMLKSPRFYRCTMADSLSLLLLVHPGDRIRVTADWGDFLSTLKIKGSPESERINLLNRQLTGTKEAIDSLAALFLRSGNPIERDSLLMTYNGYLDAHRKRTIAFILEDLSSLAAYYALFQQIDSMNFVLGRMRDLQYFKLVTDSLSKRYPRSPYVVALKQNTSTMLNEYQTRKLLGTSPAIEVGLPEVLLPSTKGDTIKLSSLKGKVVLLSFWASWNQPSVEYNLLLKEVYSRYQRKGFEVYSVSFDKNQDNWIKAIWFDQLPWINVLDDTYPGSVTAGFYNVQHLPANYLIAADFETVIDRNVSTIQLERKLESLLK